MGILDFFGLSSKPSKQRKRKTKSSGGIKVSVGMRVHADLVKTKGTDFVTQCGTITKLSPLTMVVDGYGVSRRVKKVWRIL